MAQFTKEQKTWVDRFLDKSGANGGTGTAFPDTSGLDGLDSGTVQAITPGQIIGPATQVGKKIWNWVNEQGETKVIIENRSSKVLRRMEGEGYEKLENKKDARWSKKAPPTIAPKEKATIVVKTDKLWRGKTTAVTAGSVTYEVDGEEHGIVRVGWYRKGDGELDKKFTFVESGKYFIDGYQSNDGEFTFWFTEEAPAAKPKAPDTPADKPKEPESGGGKGSKSAPPADTFVLFAQSKFVLTSEAKSRLHDFALAYLDSKSTAKIKLDGYASKEGQEASNRTLSFDRAEAVFDLLVKVENLSKDKVEWHGHGVTSDFDPKNLEPNRRVTIQLQ